MSTILEVQPKTVYPRLKTFFSQRTFRNVRRPHWSISRAVAKLDDATVRVVHVISPKQILPPLPRRTEYEPIRTK